MYWVMDHVLCLEEEEQGFPGLDSKGEFRAIALGTVNNQQTYKHL